MRYFHAKKNLCRLCFLLIIVLLVVQFPTNALAATHLHSDNCYNGTKHIHKSSCESVSSYQVTGAVKITCRSCNGSYSQPCYNGSGSWSEVVRETVWCDGCAEYHDYGNYLYSCSCGYTEQGGNWGHHAVSYKPPWVENHSVYCSDCSSGYQYLTYTCGKSADSYYTEQGTIVPATCSKVVTAIRFK